MERDDLASLAGFFAGAEPLVRGGVARLGEDAAHHIRVRRLNVGERVFLADGAGAQAVGSIVRLSRKDADVSVDDVARFDAPSPVHLIVPIADRDRMLWCAEKCAELGASIINNGLFDIQTDQPITEFFFVGDAKTQPKKTGSDGLLITGSTIQNNGTFQKSAGSASEPEYIRSMSSSVLSFW